LGFNRLQLKSFCQYLLIVCGLGLSGSLVVAQPVSRGENNYPASPSALIASPWSLPVQSLASSTQGDQSLRQEIYEYATRFLGRPYRSSGKNPKSGFDCSGFTGFIFRNFGLQLKSSSQAQATEGERIKVDHAQTGDLAFFGRKGRKGRCYVNHAAIVISQPGEPLAIIHSASRKGIVITRVNESQYWKKSLLFVKRVIRS
jgi:cell wall-associated NlpC family hydrolase